MVEESKNHICCSFTVSGVLYTGAVDFGRRGFPRIISRSLGFCTQVLLTLGGEDFLELYLLLFHGLWGFVHRSC